MIFKVALDMEKLFPIKWTNEVIHLLLSVNIRSPAMLLRHITSGTFNGVLKSKEYIGMMNSTTIQVLTNALANFCTEQSMINS